ncbi:hypothetical protein K491DRAFT_689728 [Lophiostoma macrostomum CBS 122681]|uniref:Fatty acid desaturase domain-containing protein n=1 Tax=Lophiostoma macrostomum CBS 122681 TaxID=1314788 RepID=A0A6A6THQ4_9PLEO|nr:hypothetical protein K491DRAFT_689728 [Lophiostoma macrostomum CBS 122681]
MADKTARCEPPGVAEPASTTASEYTMKDIYAAIPAHCFQRNSLLSLAYVLRDFAYVSALAYIALAFIPTLPHPFARALAWTAYSFAQGLVCTGIWELAHECGHHSLSPHKWVNNTLGMILHSFLLVPFYAWKHTHATHHKTTNNLEKDIAFIPDTEERWTEKRNARGAFMRRLTELTEDMPAIALLELVAHQLVAFPTYLLINNFALPRMAARPWWKRSHFYWAGDGPNFKPQHTRDIIVSDIGIAAVLFLLRMACIWFGNWTVVKVYVFPWLWVNHWILTVTFLQHTDASVPFYSASSWTFTRGAAAAIDRDFGWIGRHLFHGAIETHVLHHHVSRIPFYHAQEASRAIRGVMGKQYRSEFGSSYVGAFWRVRRACRFVVEVEEDGKGVYTFPETDRRGCRVGRGRGR